MTKFSARATTAPAAKNRSDSLKSEISVPSDLAKPCGMVSISKEEYMRLLANSKKETSVPPLVEDSASKTPSEAENVCPMVPAHTPAIRVRLCRHYLRGTCNRGENCNFLHDVSVFKSDNQKIFLGGVPRGMSSNQIVSEMNKAGYKVINLPSVNARGFCPKVCVDSVEKAQELISAEKVFFGDIKIDVRAYENKMGNTDKDRTVLCGRVPKSAKPEDIEAAFNELGYKLRQLPSAEDMKQHKIPVVMDTTDMAQAMTILERIKIFGRTVDLYKLVPANARHTNSPPVTRGHSHQNSPQMRSGSPMRSRSPMRTGSPMRRMPQRNNVGFGHWQQQQRAGPRGLKTVSRFARGNLS